LSKREDVGAGEGGEGGNGRVIKRMRKRVEEKKGRDLGAHVMKG
jgi:hypothetical protein